MSTDKVSDKLAEVNQRAIRIETKLTRLGQQLGVSVEDDQRVHVDTLTHTVQIDTLDVAFTTVINSARREGLHGDVEVLYLGKMIARVHIKEPRPL